MFKKRISVEQVEEGKELCPKFDQNGLIPVITTDHKSGEILMHGYMNEEAFKKTIETKEAHYFSRSRNAIWHKGKTSGWVQKVKFIRIDDDQDSLWISVDIGDGASCHVGYYSCFYRSIPLENKSNDIELKFEEKRKHLTLKLYTRVSQTQRSFKMKVLSPFGPKIGKFKLPLSIIKKINTEVDRILENKQLAKKLNYSKKLVGEVKQEFELPKTFIKKNLSKLITKEVKVFLKKSINKNAKKK